MYAWFYGGSPLIVYPLIALFLFLGVFIAVLIRTFAMRSFESYGPMAALPLSDEATQPETTNRGEAHV
jgi:hypothetical protein